MSPEISYPFNGVFNKGQENERKDVKSQAFFNLHAGDYEKEKADAEVLGVKPLLKGTPEFTALLQSKRSIKWVYTIYRELYIVPERHLITQVEIPHSIASSSKPLFIAGFGDWNKDGILELNNWTGHYEATANSARLHLEDAWKHSGINYRISANLIKDV